jgi:hypothetical protein
MKDEGTERSPHPSSGLGRIGRPLAVAVALLLSIACVVTGASAGTVFALALLLVAIFLLTG